MRILIVCGGNYDEKTFRFEIQWSFINEQMLSLKRLYDVDFDVYLIKGRGLLGYLNNLSGIKKVLKEKSYDLVHAHYGLSGLLAVLQWITPVVITYHGSDINNKFHNLLSSIAGLFAKGTVFVSEELVNKIFLKPKSNVLVAPCGIDFKLFYPVNKREARKYFGYPEEGFLALFPSSFANKIKNAPLAFQAVRLLGGVKLIELKNFNRNEVSLLLSAVDLLLMTSYSEGSPMIIKEAMACNCPIVSVDVGDVKSVILKTKSCYIVTGEPESIAEKIRLILERKERSNGREKIQLLDVDKISEQIFCFYQKIIFKKVGYGNNN